ncbi:class I SAM-dependent methyltransferase [Desulfovibrio sp. JC010]|uniref:class I SAM-dependent methyltransferase n=1 Tax=Desulfovibrio sp. JC010 TaxID=2593641 RepID=UPI0013D0CD81|nr:class I SAM-dependent methyltransferase [Desulfovibrio sp. JC010]NDV27418.1 class I SAM-dependent methyltransferase [Desulfovibrio sp. JC010]
MGAKAELFSKKMCDILNYGALNLAMGIGYETGLFEALSRIDGPASCTEIAAEAGVSERYLREWVGVMVCGGIVEVSADGQGNELFELPEEYIPFLCRSGGNSNLGVYTQEIPLLTDCARQGVLEGMKDGAGIPYARYPKFYSFMEELADAKHREVLVRTFLPSVLGGEMVRRMKKGISVCDIGCAEGVALEVMAQAFPASQFTGTDISEESLENGRKRVADLGLENITFKLQDAAGDNVEPEQFDYITAFDSIHDQTRPFAALQNIHNQLKPGGIFSMIDIKADSSISGNMEHPMGPFLYAVSLMHCMPVGLMGGGTGLGMMWGREKAVSMCRDAGFSRIEVTDIPEDGFNSHYLCFK